MFTVENTILCSQWHTYRTKTEQTHFSATHLESYEHRAETEQNGKGIGPCTMCVACAYRLNRRQMKQHTEKRNSHSVALPIKRFGWLKIWWIHSLINKPQVNGNIRLLRRKKKILLFVEDKQIKGRKNYKIIINSLGSVTANARNISTATAAAHEYTWCIIIVCLLLKHQRHMHVSAFPTSNKIFSRQTHTIYSRDRSSHLPSTKSNPMNFDVCPEFNQNTRFYRRLSMHSTSANMQFLHEAVIGHNPKTRPSQST